MKNEYDFSNAKRGALIKDGKLTERGKELMTEKRQDRAMKYLRQAIIVAGLSFIALMVYLWTQHKVALTAASLLLGYAIGTAALSVWYMFKKP